MSRRPPNPFALAMAAAALLFAGAASAGDDPRPLPAPILAKARDAVRRSAEAKEVAPDFGAGRDWLNVSRPLSLSKDLRGKVVVMDFWCYCCINCIHILPDLEYLERKYEGKAVAVVGVHSAKFANEKDAANVKEAVIRYEIRHPVVVDGDFAIWNAYEARGWPHFAVVSPTGVLLATLGGEGHRDDLDALVTATLEWYGKTPGALDAKPLPIRLERATTPSAELAYPGKLAIDAARKRLYVADSNHDRILELDLAGKFLRAFGDGTPGLLDGPAGTAHFHRPQGLCVGGGFVFVADTENHAIRRIRLDTGAVETIAGTGRQGFAPGSETFSAREVELSSPWDVMLVGDVLVIAMAGDHQLWRLDLSTSRIGAFAGDGSEAKGDAPIAMEASFAQPSGLTTDGTWIYVADSESSSVRRVKFPRGPVETLAGAKPEAENLFAFGWKDGTGFGAKFQHPLGVLFHRGTLFVADTYNHAIRAVDPATGAVTTPFGTRTPGSADDPAAFFEPSGFAADGDLLYVADSNNHRIRVIDLAKGKVSTLALTGVPIPQASAKAGGMSGGWPTLAGTVKEARPAVRVKSGEPLAVSVRLDLPDGWHLTAGAPSALRIEGLGAPVTKSIEGAETAVALPSLSGAAETSIVVRLVYYVCQEGGSCRIRAVDVTVPLTPVADAAGGIAVQDRFVP